MSFADDDSHMRLTTLVPADDPTCATERIGWQAVTILYVMAYSDGSLSLLEIGDRIGEPMWKLLPIASQLSDEGLLVLNTTVGDPC